MVCDGQPISDYYVKKPGGRVYFEPPPDKDIPRLLAMCRSWAKTNKISITAELERKNYGKHKNKNSLPN